MRSNIETNFTKNEKIINLTHKNKLMICNSCLKKIDQLYKNEYLCKECYNVRNRVYNKKHREKIKEIYDGFYLYYIVHNTSKNIIYVGYSTNIYNRHYDHYNTSYNTAFSSYITDNKLDNNVYTMYVIDLTAYKDSLTIDDVLLLEHFLIANTNLEHKILNDQGKEFDFTDIEIERIKYLYSLIDMSNYIEYDTLIDKKISYLKADNL